MAPEIRCLGIFASTVSYLGCPRTSSILDLLLVLILSHPLGGFTQGRTKFIVSVVVSASLGLTKVSLDGKCWNLFLASTFLPCGSA